jgi:preprotein translocase subunit SecD
MLLLLLLLLSSSSSSSQWQQRDARLVGISPAWRVLKGFWQDAAEAPEKGITNRFDGPNLSFDLSGGTNIQLLPSPPVDTHDYRTAILLLHVNGPIEVPETPQSTEEVEVEKEEEEEEEEEEKEESIEMGIKSLRGELRDQRSQVGLLQRELTSWNQSIINPSRPSSPEHQEKEAEEEKEKEKGIGEASFSSSPSPSPVHTTTSSRITIEELEAKIEMLRQQPYLQLVCPFLFPFSLFPLFQMYGLILSCRCLCKR